MLTANATMVFQGYEVTDTGIQMHFLCPAPGPGENSDWYIFLTDAEISAVTTVAQFKTLVLTKLQRRYRASGIATKLDQMIGQSVVI